MGLSKKESKLFFHGGTYWSKNRYPELPVNGNVDVLSHTGDGPPHAEEGGIQLGLKIWSFIDFG